jgi:hypothetical protein
MGLSWKIRVTGQVLAVGKVPDPENNPSGHNLVGGLDTPFHAREALPRGIGGALTGALGC